MPVLVVGFFLYLFMHMRLYLYQTGKLSPARSSSPTTTVAKTVFRFGSRVAYVFLLYFYTLYFVAKFNQIIYCLFVFLDPFASLDNQTISFIIIDLFLISFAPHMSSQNLLQSHDSVVWSVRPEPGVLDGRMLESGSPENGHTIV